MKRNLPDPRLQRAATAVATLAALAPSQRRITDAEARTVADSAVRAIDKAVSSGEISAYKALCRPLHPHAFDARVRWLTDAFARDIGSSESRVLDTAAIDGRAVAFVQSTLRFGTSTEAGSAAASAVASRAAERSLATHSYLVVGLHNGKPVVLLDTPVGIEHLSAKPLSQRKSSTFGCSACNYAIDTGDDDWVVVPHERAYTGCLEIMTFFSTRSATSVDVSIHVPGYGADPRKMLTNTLDARLRGAELDAARARIRDWIPPNYSENPPIGMRGAAVVAGRDLGLEHSLYASMFGPVAYLFSARSEPEAAEELKAIERLLTGFMLREADPAKVRLNVRPLAMHTGGKLEESSYRNDRYGLRFEGPSGMDGKVVCGSDLFSVHYTCSTSPRVVVLKGMPPPAGLSAWSDAQADNMITASLDRGGFQVDQDAGWSTDEDDRRFRSIRAHAKQSGAGEDRVIALRATLDVDARMLVLIYAEAPSQQMDSLLPSLAQLAWD